MVPVIGCVGPAQEHVCTEVDHDGGLTVDMFRRGDPSEGNAASRVKGASRLRDQPQPGSVWRECRSPFREGGRFRVSIRVANGKPPADVEQVEAEGMDLGGGTGNSGIDECEPHAL